jgi:hypothetical protein
MPWASIWGIFGLNGENIFQHGTEERWIREHQGLPRVSLQGKSSFSYAGVNDFIFVKTGKCTTADTVGQKISRFPGFKTVVGTQIEEQ